MNMSRYLLYSDDIIIFQLYRTVRVLRAARCPASYNCLMALSGVLWTEMTAEQPGAAAFVGAGGKTSAMALLAREMPKTPNSDFSIVLTTTTKLQRPRQVSPGIIHVGYQAPPPTRTGSPPKHRSIQLLSLPFAINLRFIVF